MANPASFIEDAPASFVADIGEPQSFVADEMPSSFVPDESPSLAPRFDMEGFGVTPPTAGERQVEIAQQGLPVADQPFTQEQATEANRAAWEAFKQPQISFPKLDIGKDDNRYVAAGKQLVNVATSVPEFFSSPLGFSAIGGATVAPTVTSGIFTADMLYNLGKKAVEVYGDVEKMTPAEQGQAAVDLVTTGWFAKAAGQHTLKGVREGLAESPIQLKKRDVKPVLSGMGRANPLQLVPALKTESGELIPGELGQSHNDILARIPEEGGQRANITLTAEKGFLVEGENDLVSRKRAGQLLGLKDELDSARLRELQEAELQKSSSTETQGAATPEVTGVNPAKAAPGAVLPIIGMGGATPQEFLPEAAFITAIKNDLSIAEQQKLGLEPMGIPERRRWAQVWNDALTEIGDDATVQNKLIESLKDSARALTDREVALLLQRKVDLLNAYNKAVNRVNEAYEAGPAGEAQLVENKVRVNELSDQLQELYDVSRTAGTQTGRGLAARKMLANQDFSLAAMEQRLRASKGGERLTDAERTKLQEAHARIQELEAQLVQQQANAKVQEFGQRVDIMAGEEQAEQRQEAKRGKVRDVMGEQAQIVEGLRSGIMDNGKTLDDLQPFVRKLALNFIRSGITDRVGLLDAVHNVLRQIDPEILKDQTMDLISGFGKSTPLNMEAARVTLRDLSNQYQQTAKMLRIMREQGIPKTGLERQPPTAAGRKLIKMVNEFKKRLGVKVDDPATQLKSALDGIKTRLQNEISDLDYAMATRQRIVKPGGGVEFDAEAAQLKLLRDEKKAAYNEIFPPEPISPAEQLARANRSLERQIAEVQRQLDKGEIFPKAKGERQRGSDVLEAKLQALKDERDWARGTVQAIDIDPNFTALQKRHATISKQIADLKARIAAGDFTPRPRKAPVTDRNIELKIAERERIKKDFNAGVLKNQLAQRPGLIKARDAFLKWRRGLWILSSPVSIVKLTAAALTRSASIAAEEAIGAGLSKVPFISQIAAKASIEGGGSAGAIIKGYVNGYSKMMKDAADTLRTGKSDLDAVWGRTNGLPPEAVEFFGRLHGMLKSPVKRYAFEYALSKQARWATKNGIDITDPLVQLQHGAAAYEWANRQIFMQSNVAVRAYKMAIRGLEQNLKATGKPVPAGLAASTVMQTELPIVTVPTNIAGEAMEYAIGTLTGSTRAALAFKRGINNLSEHDANVIMRQLKKGAIGAAVFYWGYYNADKIGGFYQHGQKQDPDAPKAGDLKVGDTTISHNVMHAPILMMAQLGATTRRIAESYDRNASEPRGLVEGIGGGLLGLAEEIPFVKEQLDTAKIFNASERADWAGNEARSLLIPGAVQWSARRSDIEPGTGNWLTGDVIRRDPENFAEQLKIGVPGLRQQVQEKIGR